MAAALGLAPKLLGESSSGAQISGPNSLRAHASAVGLLVGCAVVPELLTTSDAAGDEAYTRIVAEQASILVPENAMKWAALRPTSTTFDFTRADRVMAFAAAHNQQVRGHNLCWHEALPIWFASRGNKDNAKALLTQHIETVAGRYAGRMHSWDVVNEAVHIPDGRADGLRKSPWLEFIGPDYVELAFTTAAKADPQARLTYNDYDIELDTPEHTAKRGQVLMLVRRLHSRGVPIRAVGIQSHLQANGPQPGAGLIAFIRELAGMNLEVYVTEMDVNSHSLPGDAAAQDVAVSAVYETYLNLVLKEPNVKAALLWGIVDSRSWLNESHAPWAQRRDGTRQRPLLFDENYLPKSAFFAMRGAFDTARQVPISLDVTAPASNGDSDPYAPFAVPGSPGTAHDGKPDEKPAPKL